jgi:hypothetical protein
MKGLLHRLAARAVGRAVPVRADARLSFGGAGLGWADAGEQAASLGRQAARTMPLGESVAPVPPAHDRELGRRSEAGAMPFSSMSGPFTHPRGDEVPAAPRLFEPQQARPVEPRLLCTASAQTPPPESGERSSARSSAVTVEVAPRRTIEVSGEGLAFVTKLLVESSSDTPDTPVMRPSPESKDPALKMPGPAALPPALRPASSSAQPNAAFSAPKVSHSPASAARQGAAAAGDDRTEVHIHIGRIDVTALPDAPLRRAPAAAAAPMSLDAYLARRSRS